MFCCHCTLNPLYFSLNVIFFLFTVESASNRGVGIPLTGIRFFFWPTRNTEMTFISFEFIKKLVILSNTMLSQPKLLVAISLFNGGLFYEAAAAEDNAKNRIKERCSNALLQN